MTGPLLSTIVGVLSAVGVITWGQAPMVEGWIQLTVQGGALALLFIVVYYGPRWFKSILKDQAEERSIALKAQQDERLADRKNLTRIVTEFKKQVDALQDRFAKRNSALEAAIREQTDELKSSLEELKSEVNRHKKNAIDDTIGG